jgi:hypothetical protein
MSIGNANSIAIRRGIVYEGDPYQLWAIHPLPMIVPAALAGLDSQGGGKRNMIFREDVFDPLTRIRRGRFYCLIGGRSSHTRSASQVSNGVYGPLVGITTDQFDEDNSGQIASVPDVNAARREIVRLGSDAATTYWRVIDVEQNVLGQQVFTLRAKSLFGVLPELNAHVTKQDGGTLADGVLDEVRQSLAALVDTYHRFQPVPTVDAARETARVILSKWIGCAAHGKDLGDVKKALDKKSIFGSAAHIVGRMHARGKSAERESQASKGANLREPTDEDAETSVHLVGMMLREIGWAAA